MSSFLKDEDPFLWFLLTILYVFPMLCTIWYPHDVTLRLMAFVWGIPFWAKVVAYAATRRK
jgi:hypothetical protein